MNTFRKLRAFCRVLRGSRQWYRHETGWLRTQIEGGEGPGHPSYCPLTYAYYVQTGEIIPVSEFARAAASLGFTKTEAEQIADAADKSFGFSTQIRQLRRILEKACRIK